MLSAHSSASRLGSIQFETASFWKPLNVLQIHGLNWDRMSIDKSGLVVNTYGFVSSEKRVNSLTTIPDTIIGLQLTKNE